MAKRQEAVKKQHEQEEEIPGTFASVMFLLGFIIVTWVGVLILFLVR